MAPQKHAKRAMLASMRSMNKSIKEIEAFLEHDYPTAKPGTLRARLHLAIEDLAETWFRRGFKQGHRTSRAHYLQSGKVPLRLRLSISRPLFSVRKRKMDLRSKVKGS
jgi:hypothetical protein